MSEQWWEQDPITIIAVDRDGITERFMPPPSIRRFVGYSPVNYDCLAEASAKLLGYPCEPMFAEMWVRMLGPIEYAHSNVMPEQLGGRIHRALNLIDLDNVFEFARLFAVDHRWVPKGVKVKTIHVAVRTMIENVLYERVVAVPKPYRAPRPNDIVRSGPRPPATSR